MASSVTTNLSAISASVTSTTNNNNNSTSSSSSFDNNNDNIKVDIIKSSPIIDEEIADEVKVFRSNTNDDDPNDGSSAELHADKQELALEADLESQTDFTQQHVNPIVNPFAPLHWPSPGSNFMFNSLLALSSPVYAAAQQKLAAAAIAQVYSAAATAAFVARHSPNYFNFGAQFGAPHAYEQPPSFSMGQPQCTTPSNNNNNNTSRNNNTNNCFNFQQQQHQLGSPMTSLGGVFGNICLGNDRGENSSAFKHQNNFDNQKQQQHLLSSTDKCYIDSRGQLKTPKLENNDHGRIKEKRHLHSNGKNNNNLNNESKREHIKKPMNAFMLFMKENRHKYMDETNDRKKQSAELNKELGQIWQKMSKDEQQPYYEMAQQKREEHQQLYPNWTARENYAIHKKAKRRRTRERSFENNDQKKCRARFGVDNQAKWCKHCRRKKRCLNVCDSSSPLHQVCFF